jgi:hypothetical protein
MKSHQDGEREKKEGRRRKEKEAREGRVSDRC